MNQLSPELMQMLQQSGILNGQGGGGTAFPGQSPVGGPTAGMAPQGMPMQAAPMAPLQGPQAPPVNPYAAAAGTPAPSTPAPYGAVQGGFHGAAPLFGGPQMGGQVGAPNPMQSAGGMAARDPRMLGMMGGAQSPSPGIFAGQPAQGGQAGANPAGHPGAPMGQQPTGVQQAFSAHMNGPAQTSAGGSPANGAGGGPTAGTSPGQAPQQGAAAGTPASPNPMSARLGMQRA